MNAGINAVLELGEKSGIKAISAGNYGGKLGPFLFNLKKIVR